MDFGPYSRRSALASGCENKLRSFGFLDLFSCCLQVQLCHYAFEHKSDEVGDTSANAVGHNFYILAHQVGQLKYGDRYTAVTISYAVLFFIG